MLVCREKNIFRCIANIKNSYLSGRYHYNMSKAEPKCCNHGATKKRNIVLKVLSKIHHFMKLIFICYNTRWWQKIWSMSYEESKHFAFFIIDFKKDNIWERMKGCVQKWNIYVKFIVNVLLSDLKIVFLTSIFLWSVADNLFYISYFTSYLHHHRWLTSYHPLEN